MKIKEAYKVMQASCGIVIGDTVRVVRGCEKDQWGSNNYAIPSGDIGKIGVVCFIQGIDGMRLKGDSFEARWWFPFFCLEKVKSKPHTIAFDGQEPVEISDKSYEALKKALE